MFQVAEKTKQAPRVAMVVLTAAVFSASAGLPRGAEPAAPPLPEKQLTFRDIQLTVHARKALADDPVLGPANLGVRIQDNTAVLWGPAPSDAAKRRAVEIVKQVQGVFEVRDADVYIAAPPPLMPTLPPPDAPTHTESDSPDPDTGTLGDLTARPLVDASPTATVVLKAPLPLADDRPTGTPEDLAASLGRIRAREPRFQAVDYRLEGDTVVLRFGPGDAEDVMAFARAIAHLPGLTHISVRAE